MIFNIPGWSRYPASGAEPAALMGAAFSFSPLSWPFRARPRAKRARKPAERPAQSIELEREPRPQLTSALREQDAAAQAQEWCLQYLGGDLAAAPERQAAPKRAAERMAPTKRREAVAEPLPERDEATALELEEDVHDEIRRLRRLGTAELAGCLRADSDIALLLAAAELVATRADADAEGVGATEAPAHAHLV